MTDATILTVDAVLFDMDGTLIDSSVVVERTWRAFASRHGLDPDKILATAHGRRTEETVARYLPEGIDVVAETRRIVAEEVADTAGVVAVPGAAELLASLPRRRWAMVTSAGRALARRRMAAAGLPFPPVVITAEDVLAGKPAPDGYLAAADALGVPAIVTVIFEDAEAGLRAAVASGATTVVVGRHHGPAAKGLVRIPDFSAVAVAAGQTEQDPLQLRLPAATALNGDSDHLPCHL